MTTKMLSAAASLALLSACVRQSPEGIWLVELPYVESEACTTQVQHNFTEAYVPGEVAEEEDEWVEDSTVDYSPMLFFAQIAVESNELAVMVTNDEIWPGSRNDEGAWVFAWEGSEVTDSTMVHETGYAYTEVSASRNISRLTMTLDGDVAQASWRSELRGEATWTESDAWDRDSGVYYSELPAHLYLESDTQDYVENTDDGDECGGEFCELQVVESCADTAPVTMTRVGFEDEDTYEHLEDDSRTYGTGFGS